MSGEENILAIRRRPSLAWLPLFLKTFPQADVFFVGGCVRDAILDRSTKDVDIVIQNLDRPQIEHWCTLHGTIDLVGKTFGVYKFTPKGYEEEIDIALPRTEQATEKSHGGYKEFTVDASSDLPIEMDLARRDFTVNAMAFDIRAERLVDPHHGARDLQAKMIRTVGSPKERFGEDLSRILRAIRFACTLGFYIEEQTWSTIQSLVPHLQQKIDDHWVVPRETIGKEFLLSFLTDPTCTLVRYETSGLFSILFPTVDVALATSYLKDASGLSAKLLLALFLSATDPDEALHILMQYHFSQFPRTDRFHVDTQELAWLLRSVHLIDVMESPSLLHGSAFERMFLGDRGEDLLALITLIRPEAKEKMRRVQERREQILSLWGDEIPQLVSGQDLIASGLTPGPVFRKMQQAVRDAQLEGVVKTKEEALNLIKKLITK